MPCKSDPTNFWCDNTSGCDLLYCPKGPEKSSRRGSKSRKGWTLRRFASSFIEWYSSWQFPSREVTDRWGLQHLSRSGSLGNDSLLSWLPPWMLDAMAWEELEMPELQPDCKYDLRQVHILQAVQCRDCSKWKMAIGGCLQKLPTQTCGEDGARGTMMIVEYWQHIIIKGGKGQLSYPFEDHTITNVKPSKE